MSDKADKRKPIAERIAQLGGRGSFCNPRDGTGGIPTLTDQDIAAALGMVRHILKEVGNPSEIGAEVLVTHYQATTKHRHVLRAAYLRANPPVADKGYPAIVVRRMGATLGVHMLGGLVYSRRQEDEYAYLCHCRVSTLQDEMDRAHRWFLDRLQEAHGAFMTACRRAHDERLVSERQERAERVDRVLADIAAEKRSAAA
jgi:hypothetical protein